MMRKKVIPFLCTAALLAGCGTSSTSSSSTFTAGTYTATAAGRNGDVTLTVTFSDTEITDIQVEQSETSGLGDEAISTLTEETLSSQAVPADVVSGATISSNAYLDALKDTITQAGANPDDLTAQAAEAEEVEYVTEADVIVVGAGGAGLTAAITASQEGASVILLEKSSTLGGNTLAAANGVNAADSQTQLDDEAYVNVGGSVEGLIEVQSQNDLARENLVKVFAENSGEMIDWFTDQGVSYTVEISEDDRNAVQNNYMLQADSDDSTAVTMINTLKTTLESTDVILYTNMEAYELVVENDAVTGVKATDANGNDITFSATSVLLTTGGFGQNSELLGEVSPYLANAITDEIAPTTGDGLLMAEAVGAKTVDLDQIQTFPVVISGYGMVTPNKLPGGFGVDGAIYVNQEGERFTAEAFESVDAVLSQTDGKAYMIFSEEYLNENLQQILDAGFIQSADTAEELAQKLGIDEDAFAQTVSTWNEHIENGTDDEYGREGGSQLTGKLYGFEFGVGAHYFMGGILINENTQVLDEDENPIQGLYAAGEVTGGFHGSQRVDGSGLSDSFTFGRIAGKVVAEAANN